jgi:hypothetical protein
MDRRSIFPIYPIYTTVSEKMVPTLWEVMPTGADGSRSLRYLLNLRNKEAVVAWELHCGDVLTILPALPADSVDLVIGSPPSTWSRPAAPPPAAMVDRHRRT